MKKNNLKGSAILLVAALIWGLAFVAQSDAADHIPPFAFNALRSFIAAGMLGVLLALRCRKNKTEFLPTDPKLRRLCLLGGLGCGVFLAISVNLQQAGLTSYPDGVAASARGGFITAIYVIIVPILSVVFGKKIPWAVWPAVLVALSGTYLLCLAKGLSGIYIGDLLMLGCAFNFSFQIMLIDRYGEQIGGVRLSFLQFTVCAVISLAISLIFEPGGFAIDGIRAALFPILYLGIMSSGVAYTLQILGQRFAEPAVASLTMSLESVFAALGGWLIASDILSPREILGCALVFAAILIVQLPDLIKKRKKTNS